MRIRVALSLFATLATFACNDVRFAGGTRSNANRFAPGSDLSCTVHPEALRLGDIVQVAVTASNGFAGPIYQTVKGPKEPVSYSLVASEGAFLREDGSSNQFGADAVGEYVVELRRDPDQEDFVNSCSFKVEADVSGRCTLSSSSPRVGEEVLVKLELGSSYSGSLTQKISGPKAIEIELVASESGVKTSDGKENRLSFSEAGDYTIEFSFPDGVAAEMESCKVSVSELITCPEGTKYVGANVAFLIDNSYSNVATDCPGRRDTGEVISGSKIYECQAATGRETAVLTAFDELRIIAEKSPSDPLATSRTAVVSFPDNDIDGFNHRSKTWISTQEDGRAALSELLGFTRRPQGLTPFAAAMDGALALFSNSELESEKAKVAVLVSDGEPTDQNPAAVVSQAKLLAEQGVEVITVFVTNGEDKNRRIEEHKAMLGRFDAKSRSLGLGSWWDNEYLAAQPANLQRYLDDIVGSEQTASLIEKVTAKADKNCSDQPGSICERKIVAVENSDGLRDTFRKIIREEAIRCEP